MLTLNVKIDNIEITDNGTTIITMAPVNNIRWISNATLIAAGVAVLPYGVITVPKDVTTTGIMVTVVVNGVPYEVELDTLMAGAAGDEITLKQPSLDLGDLNDVNITDPQDGNALVYDAATSKWINGAGGGGGGDNISFVTKTESALVISGTEEAAHDVPITLEPMSLMGGTVYGHYMPPDAPGISFRTADSPIYAIEFTIDGVKYTTNHMEDLEGEAYYLLMAGVGGPILGYGDRLFFMMEERTDITFSMVYKEAEPTAFFINTIQDIITNLGN